MVERIQPTALRHVPMCDDLPSVQRTTQHRHGLGGQCRVRAESGQLDRTFTNLFASWSVYGEEILRWIKDDAARSLRGILDDLEFGHLGEAPPLQRHFDVEAPHGPSRRVDVIRPKIISQNRHGRLEFHESLQRLPPLRLHHQKESADPEALNEAIITDTFQGLWRRMSTQHLVEACAVGTVDMNEPFIEKLVAHSRDLCAKCVHVGVHRPHASISSRTFS
mmetsp:Transcript_8157/g.20452  ORF Transcript_8157/g.20452 Transcript_8157/m.20452 type:complete len:221 (+) Transcript_8157:1297-1959(+)